MPSTGLERAARNGGLENGKGEPAAWELVVAGVCNSVWGRRCEDAQ